MSAITLGGDLVHYEVLGRGRPVVLLHGWLGSWRYWIPTIQQLHVSYRVYAVDLYGFGDSSKNPAKLSLQQQVQLLARFMDEMGLPKAAFIGHALGAWVLTEYAKQNPERIARMVLCAPPLFDPGNLEERVPAGQMRLLKASQSPSSTPAPAPKPLTHDAPTIPSRSMLMASGRFPLSPDMAAKAAEKSGADDKQDASKQTLPSSPAADGNKPTSPSTTSAAFGGEELNLLRRHLGKATLIELLNKCFKRTEAPYEKLKIDVDKTSDAVLHSSITQFDAATYLDDLRRIESPIGIIHGSDDPVIPMPTETVWQYLTVGKEGALVPVPLNGVRHFPMLEYEPFVRLIKQFFETDDFAKIEIKERWKRRSI
ncbi:MAG: alpha/beta hydrolase [Chloroflexi bacterium]|nr:MAG: alpha/beta hydrolase [Chloroflexota bacterium]